MCTNIESVTVEGDWKDQSVSRLVLIQTADYVVKENTSCFRHTLENVRRLLTFRRSRCTHANDKTSQPS